MVFDLLTRLQIFKMSTDDSSDEERAFLPRDVRPEDELEYDEESYIVYRQASLGPPCLSFDIIPQAENTC